MNIDQLNSRYGAPGRIVFRPGHCGYPNVVLANKYGTAEIALLGANVLSYRPTGKLLLADGSRVTLDCWHHVGVREFEKLLPPQQST